MDPHLTSHSPEASVREYIDTTLTGLLHQLSLPPADSRPAISLKRRPSPASCTINPSNRALEETAGAQVRRSYSWPGRTAYEAWRFTVVIRVLSIIEQAMRTGKMISKRDIYYIDPEYFRSQTIVDGVIDDLAYTIGVDRDALHVEAAAKGLTVGCFRLKKHASSEVVYARTSSMVGTHFPEFNEDVDEIDITGVRWVLVVEKEVCAVLPMTTVNQMLTGLIGSLPATRSKLLSLECGIGRGYFGDGYPDLCTRKFLRRLSDAAAPNIPFYALVDGDPDGVAIMSTYKYGSAAHAHNNSRLNIPSLQWLGLRVTDASAGVDSVEDGALLSLTARDRKKTVAMLWNSPVLAHNGPELRWRAELQRMLMLNIKAEIEVLYEQEKGLEGWIDQEMSRQVH
ncbi:hypothetical protein N7474_000218 [Penicillium riverlandense]|uniref:uncharacterized protein n=1 Tax=Penicillium riverlandense TaxID=1903569 RepID=UPI002546C9B8|nr:uncharacterized protein N7474_000218 [Penicillium riverlandense]KAJ5831907.1 hypothetical protein N7474_000218 [Penicillium riverlandense]